MRIFGFWDLFFRKFFGLESCWQFGLALGEVRWDFYGRACFDALSPKSCENFSGCFIFSQTSSVRSWNETKVSFSSLLFCPRLLRLGFLPGFRWDVDFRTDCLACEKKDSFVFFSSSNNNNGDDRAAIGLRANKRSFGSSRFLLRAQVAMTQDDRSFSHGPLFFLIARNSHHFHRRRRRRRRGRILVDHSWPSSCFAAFSSSSLSSPSLPVLFPPIDG